MKLEQNDKSLVFSTTELPDVFFAEYLTTASGDFVKVYLYMFYLSKYGKEIKLTDLSKTLGLPLKTINEALKYWESIDVITKKTSGFIFNNLQDMELHKLYSPKLTASPEQALKNAKSKKRARAIQNINNSYFQGLMRSTWYTDIDLWFDKYGFEDSVMIALFDYCFSRSALHRNYVQAVADAWSNNGIKTYTDLETYYDKQEKLNKIKQSITKKLGRRNSPLTQYEEAYIEKWILDYGYGLDIIEIALKRTTFKSNPTFEYLNKLISNWHERNFKSPEEINAFIEQMQKQTKDIKKLKKETTTASKRNFDQRSYSDDDFDFLYVNKG